MDPSGSELSEDDVLRLGAQQAAMMKMQEEVEQRAESENQQQLYDAQKEALAMQQAAMLEQEKQQKIMQEQQLMHAQMAALVEKQAEQQARERQLAMQQQMLMQKEKEEQERIIMLQQQKQQEIVAAAAALQQQAATSSVPSLLAGGPPGTQPPQPAAQPPPQPLATVPPGVPVQIAVQPPPQVGGGPPSQHQGAGGPPPPSVPSAPAAPPPLMAQPVQPPMIPQVRPPGVGTSKSELQQGPHGPIRPLMATAAIPPAKKDVAPEDQGPPGVPRNQGPPQDLDDLDKPKEQRLPQALEKVLAFKDMRAQQVGVKPEDIEKVESGELLLMDDEAGEVEYTNEPEYIEEVQQPAPSASKNKESKNKKRKNKKKKSKERKGFSQPPEWKTKTEVVEEENVEIEYVQDCVDLSDPVYSQFRQIFETFKITEPEKKVDAAAEPEKREEKKEVPIKAKGFLSDSDSASDDEKPPEEDKPRLSKKKMKKLNRLSVAELKQLVSRPDVVEMHDVTARDPKLLVHLKATRNTVPVPRHWCFKRKYLQGKRGIEKPPFELPDFIKATGVMEMRQALQEKEDQKSMKQKMRERVRPKMGKIDIDYQKLHDAFFRWQIKPKMTIHGDLYYEGKEFETRLREKKPGNLSDELRIALGMPVGANAEKVPPPWLIAMQRYGPPPSYPNLKIPGLNAPIPDGCAFGYHAGGWGKPPVDENGKPLYGDVFGTQSGEFTTPVQEEDIDKSYWGELESESESEEESEEDSEEEEETQDASGLVTPGETGLITPSGVSSVPIGVETPDMIELRKRRIEDAMDQGGDTPALYTVLPEKKTTGGGGAQMMGSAHVYDMSGVAVPGKKTTEKMSAEGVEVALNPDELDLDTAAMQAKYEQTVKEQQSQLEKEDLSDMVAEHAAKQSKKRKKQQQEQQGKSSKKYKEFKF